MEWLQAPIDLLTVSYVLFILVLGSLIYKIVQRHPEMPECKGILNLQMTHIGEIPLTLSVTGIILSQLGYVNAATWLIVGTIGIVILLCYWD